MPLDSDLLFYFILFSLLVVSHSLYLSIFFLVVFPLFPRVFFFPYFLFFPSVSKFCALFLFFFENADRRLRIKLHTIYTFSLCSFYLIFACSDHLCFLFLFYSCFFTLRPFGNLFFSFFFFYYFLQAPYGFIESKHIQKLGSMCERDNVDCLRFMCFNANGFYYLGIFVIVRTYWCKVLIY